MAGQGVAPPAYTGGKLPFTLPYEKTAQNVLAWILNPLPNVGSRTAPLRDAPSGIDHVSMPGCKGQSFTTWNCMSRSIYVGHCVSLMDIKSGVLSWAKNMPDVNGLPLLASPWSEAPPELLDRYPETMVQGLETGDYFYSKAISGKEGIYTRKQLEYFHSHLLAGTYKLVSQTPESEREELLEAQVATESKPEPTTDGDLPQKKGTSYLYSDILPVRVVAVGNWISKFSSNESVPYSPMYQVFLSRLSDPASVGALGSITRGPGIRDATSILSLAKGITNSPGSIHEHAALVRAGCVAVSLDPYAYDGDFLPSQMVRRFKPNMDEVVKVNILTEDQSYKYPQISILATTLDYFVSLAIGKTDNSFPAGYKYMDLDSGFVAVPISSSKLGTDYARGYIMSYYTSALWAGRVNVIRPGKWKDDTWNDYVQGHVSLMPRANSVYIPGPTKVLLVLTDMHSTDSQATISIAGMLAGIQIIKSGRQGVATDITQWWRDFFTTANAPEIMSTFGGGWNHICQKLGVGTTCGFAASVVAELYGNQQPGMAVNAARYTNRSRTAYGAWAWKGGDVDKKIGIVHSSAWKEDLNGADNAAWRQALVGFNFAGTSPLHRLSTGIVRSKYTVEWQNSDDKTTRIPKIIRAGWSTEEPSVCVPGYNIETMSSVMRIATYVGLLSTHEGNYTFGSAYAVGSYIHMLSVALGLSFSTFLSTNDISMNMWSGCEEYWRRLRPDESMSQIADVYTAGLVAITNIKDLSATTGDWDWAQTSVYYSIKPFADNDWFSYSPWPVHAVHQWTMKLSLWDGQLDRTLQFFVRQGGGGFGGEDAYIQGLALRENAGHYKSMSVASIDLFRYAPGCMYRQVGSIDAPMRTWCDQWQMLSQVYVNKLGDTQYLQTNTMTLAIMDKVFFSPDDNRFLVYDTNYICPSEDRYVMRANTLAYPDPPSFSTFWEGLRDYIAVPALSGLAGYVSGGPVGALVGAGTSLAKQVLNDTKKTTQPEKADQNSARLLVSDPVDDIGTSRRTIDSTFDLPANE